MVERCFVLREDPELARAIAPASREWAVRDCVAPVLTLPRGRWDPARTLTSPDGIGLLVLSGQLIRRVAVDGRGGAELLGDGDLLRPWQGQDTIATVSSTIGWRVLTPARLAVLDGRMAEQLARYPSLVGAVAARAIVRARRLVLLMAIVHHPRIEVRLHMLLWHLADRWGRVRPDGVLVPLRLPHAVLADLVAAQRPSVTMALGQLCSRDHVTQVREGWLLRGDPPGELLTLHAADAGLPPGAADAA